LSGLLVFVAVLGAPILHAPVLALDLFKRLKRPLDGGATIGGRRLFGDNKTWRGALFMVAGPTLAAVLLTRWPAYRDALPDAVSGASPVLWGALVGLGVVVGELPNSFLKRRLDIAPGTIGTPLRSATRWGPAGRRRESSCARRSSAALSAGTARRRTMAVSAVVMH
jgi:hypothetical protein